MCSAVCHVHSYHTAAPQTINQLNQLQVPGEKKIPTFKQTEGNVILVIEFDESVYVGRNSVNDMSLGVVNFLYYCT